MPRRPRSDIVGYYHYNVPLCQDQYSNKSYCNLLTNLPFIKDNINYKYTIILSCKRRIDAYRVWWL